MTRENSVLVLLWDALTCQEKARRKSLTEAALITERMFPSDESVVWQTAGNIPVLQSLQNPDVSFESSM